jgi:signal transduction histidine kinase
MILEAPDLPIEISIAPSEQPRLLVVDDEVASALALQNYLTRQGYDVQVAYTGRRALEEIAIYRPHLLILDLLMPDISGLDITMHVRSDPTLSYLPVIMITAQDQERKRLQSMVSGADDYIAKPVNELELLVRVQALLRTKTEIDRLMSQNDALLRDLEARNAELEQALLAVKEANLLKRNILNSVTHEMGTPLLQIKSAVHLLSEDVRRADPDNVPARLVTQAIARMEGILNNITDLVRSENLRQESFILNDAVDLAMRRLGRSGIEAAQLERIRRHYPDDLPLVRGDRRAVARVLMLFLENALKFDPSGQDVTIQAEVDGERVCIAVQDQGIGIPEAEFDHIFKEFYQIDSSPTRHFGGSGLGLALAKLLCDMMETPIFVESQVGVGSTFFFYLPIAPDDLLP